MPSCVCVCFLFELARRLSLCLGASHCFEQECGGHETARDQSIVEKEFMTPFIWSREGVLGERWGIAVNGSYWTLFREARVLALGDRPVGARESFPEVAVRHVWKPLQINRARSMSRGALSISR